MLIEVKLFDGRLCTLETDNITAVFAGKHKKRSFVLCGTQDFEVLESYPKLLAKWAKARGA